MSKWSAAEGSGWKQHRVATPEVGTATKVATEVTGGGDYGDEDDGNDEGDDGGDDDTGNNYKG